MLIKLLIYIKNANIISLDMRFNPNST